MGWAGIGWVAFLLGFDWLDYMCVWLALVGLDVCWALVGGVGCVSDCDWLG